MLNGSCRCRGVGASHTPPPLPTMSTSSSSSPSGSSQLTRSGTGTGTACARNIKSSEVETSGAHGSSPSSSITGTATTRASAKKKDKEYLCPRCGGDVRLPPLPKIQSSASSENEPKTKSITEIGFHSSEPFVVCALGCTSPRYHLSCTGVPAGSQVYRSVFLSTQSSPDNPGAQNGITDSSFESAWTELSQASLPKKRSYQSLQNDKSWTTSMLSFICPKCDVEGTSRYLAEYFEQFHSLKKSFYSRYLSGGAKRKNSHRLERADESVEARTGEAFLWHLMQTTRQEYLVKQQSKGTMTLWNSSEIKLNSMAFVLTYLAKQLQQEHVQQHQRRQKRQKVKFQLDPSYLVGMPIRLFNPIDNSYNTGRIIDYKVDAPYIVDEPISSSKQPDPSVKLPIPNFTELTDEKISRTLFFVRFRPGVEGRKLAVHQWIFLEEHAVAVGSEICWGKVGNDICNTNGASNMQNVASSYRPCQIIFRSLLEMIHVQNLNPSTPCNDSNTLYPYLNVLAMGFGLAFSHIRLKLGESHTDANDKHSALTLETGTANAAMPPPENNDRPQAVPLAASNPTWIDQMLQRVELSDEDVALGLAMAHMEKEEERRVRVRHNLVVSRLSFTPHLGKRT